MGEVASFDFEREAQPILMGCAGAQEAGTSTNHVFQIQFIGQPIDSNSQWVSWDQATEILGSEQPAVSSSHGVCDPCLDSKKQVLVEFLQQSQNN